MKFMVLKFLGIFGWCLMHRRGFDIILVRIVAGGAIYEVRSTFFVIQTRRLRPLSYCNVLVRLVCVVFH